MPGDGFRIAQGYIEIETQYDTDKLQRAAEKAFSSMGGVGEKTGRKIGQRLGQAAVTNTASSFGSGMRVFGKNPYVLAGIAVLVTVLSPLIATALTTALLGGLGVAFIAIGAFFQRQNPKLEKQFQNTMDRITRVMEKASKPLVGPLIKALDTIGDAVERMGPTFERIFSKLGPMIDPLVRGLMGLVENALPGFERAMGGIEAVFKALGVHLPKLGTAIGDFFAELGKDPDLIERVVGLMITWLENFLKVAGPFIEGLMVLFGAMATHWQTFKMAWNDFWGAADPNVMNPIKEAFGGLWDAIKKVWGAYREFAKATSDQEVVTSSANLVESLKNLWEKFKDTVAAIWGVLWEKIKKIWNEYVKPWLKREMQDLLDYLIKLVNEKFERMKNDAVQKLKMFVVAVADNINPLFGIVMRSIVGLPGGVGDTFGKIPGRVSGALSSLSSRVGSAFSAARSTASSLSQSAVNAAISIFSTAPSRAGSALASLSSRVRGAVSGAGGWLYSAGRAVVDGLINGLLSRIGALASAASRLGSIIKNNKGPIEKDRKMLIPEGQAIAKSLELGLMSSVPSLERAVSGLTAAIPGMASAGSSGSQAIAGTAYHFAPGSIVLDASKIKDIQDLLNMVNSLSRTARQYGARPMMVGV